MQKQKYTIYACLIISFATYSFSLKEANQLVIDYQESMSLVSSYMVRKAQAEEVSPAPLSPLEEVLAVELIEDTTQEDESIEGTIKDVFGSDWKIALAVATSESSLDPTRIGDKHIQEPSYGLFQINTYWNPKYDPDKLLEVRYNCESAREMSLIGRGWDNWTQYRNGAYLEHLIK